jgi:DNA polymerase III alpha subunit (gram-positive type)
MIYCSIDIETTGLDPENNKILSIGVIIEDTTKKLPYDELPKFNAIILQRQIVGSPRAITMNAELINIMSDYLEGNDEVKKLLDEKSGYKFYESDSVVKELFDFLYENNVDKKYPNIIGLKSHVRVKNGITYPVFTSDIKPITINVAGKNFGTFDKLFLNQLPWFKKLIITRQRTIDPAILFCDFNEDETLPSLSECKKRLGVSDVVTHNALDDAWDVIQLMRKFY